MLCHALRFNHDLLKQKENGGNYQALHPHIGHGSNKTIEEIWALHFQALTGESKVRGGLLSSIFRTKMLY